MNEPQIRFPVTCPECGTESLTEVSVADVAVALIAPNPLRLTAPCHGVSWQASDLELQQIREYLGALIIEAQRD